MQRKLNLMTSHYLAQFLRYEFATSVIRYPTKRNKQGTKINLSRIKSFSTLSGGCTCCYIQMSKTLVCWKVFHIVWYTISSTTLVRCLTNNITSYHMLEICCQITPTPEYIIQEAKNTHNGNSGVFLTEQMWVTNTLKR